MYTEQAINVFTVGYQEADNDHAGEAIQMVQQMLTYKLDLGLNHVVRKHNEPMEDQANLLIAGMSVCVRAHICTCI